MLVDSLTPAVVIVIEPLECEVFRPLSEAHGLVPTNKMVLFDLRGRTMWPLSLVCTWYTGTNESTNKILAR